MLVKGATGAFVARRVDGHHKAITASIGSVEAFVLIRCKPKYEDVEIKTKSGPWFRAVERLSVFEAHRMYVQLLERMPYTWFTALFQKDEISNNISIRYQYFLIHDLPYGTRSVLSCCDWSRPLAYWHCVSNTRAKAKFMRKCEIQCHLKNSSLKEMGIARSIGGFCRWMEATSDRLDLLWMYVNWNQHNKKQTHALFALHLQHAEPTSHPDHSKCRWHRWHCPVHVQCSNAAVSTAGTEAGGWTWQAPPNTFYCTNPWTITVWINALHIENDL